MYLMFNGNFTLNWHKWNHHWNCRMCQKREMRRCLVSSDITESLYQQLLCAVLQLSIEDAQEGVGGTHGQSSDQTICVDLFSNKFSSSSPKLYAHKEAKTLEINLKLSRRIACQVTTLLIPRLQVITLPWPIFIKI